MLSRPGRHLVRRALLAGLLLAPLAARAELPPAAQPIAALNDGLLAAMRAGRASPFADRAAALGPVVEKTFALDAILRASVGPRFTGLPAAEQSALLAAFTDYTVASYVSSFDAYAGERFEVDPATRAVGADQVVATRIIPPNGSPTRLDYVMRQGAGGWRAIDVLVDGNISRAAVQRSDFRGLLAGGSAAPLIASLREKASRLAGGGKAS